MNTQKKMKARRIFVDSSDDPRIMKTCCCCLDVRLGTIMLGFVHLVRRELNTDGRANNFCNLLISSYLFTVKNREAYLEIK